MCGIWDHKATDEEIAKCKGDYIGCEICCNANKCIDILLKKLEQAMQENKSREEL